MSKSWEMSKARPVRVKGLYWEELDGKFGP